MEAQFWDSHERSTHSSRMFRGVLRNLLPTFTMSEDTKISINGHTFRITWSSVIHIGVTIIALLGIYFTTTGRLDKSERHLVELDKRADIGQDQRDRMDREGTRRSHEIDAMQQQLLEAHTAQLAEFNRKLGDMMPKVDKIDANVLWLMGKQLEARK